MVNVQKHKLFLSLLLLTITGIFSACTDDTEQFGIHNGTPLNINVGVNTTESRAIITGNSLPEGSQIGVTVVDQSGNGYQDQNYNNVCYQAVTEDGSQKWRVQSRSDILLSGEAGTLYAYYPWSSAVSDIKQIAVNMDETDQKDWMVAQPVTNLSDAQATAAVKMEHMLTNFKLSFYKDNYSGKGEVTAVTIRSNGFATTATLDATTGAFTAYGDAHTLTRPFATTLGTDKAAAAPCNIMVVPNTVAAPVTVSVTVDGKTYSSVTSSLTLAKAKSYNYAMKLSSTGLDIAEVTLTDWNTRDLGETEFKPEGAEQQESYDDWVKLTYKIEDVSEPVNLFCYYYESWEENGEFYEELTSLDLNLLDEVVIKDIGKITPAYKFMFSTPGEYTVYVKFKDMTTIPDYAFAFCGSLIDFELPNSVTTIGDMTFAFTGLYQVNIPGSVKYIGLWGFQDCDNLETVILNNGILEIEQQAFYGCNNLKNVVLPNTINKLSEMLFSDCKGLENISIPNSVKVLENHVFDGCSALVSVELPTTLTTISYSVFGGCSSLTSLTLPATLTSIGEEVFEACSSLKEIISLSVSAPTIGIHTFYRIKEGGVLYIPSGATGYDAWMQTSSYHLGYYNWKMIEITETETFSFTIGSSTYQAEEGMTWEQWVNSSYNTGGFYLEDYDEEHQSYVLIKNNSGIVAVQGSAESADDIISSSRNYQLYGSVILPGFED